MNIEGYEDFSLDEPGTPVGNERESLSFATQMVRGEEEDEEQRRVFAVWVAAALIFICVGITGAITATAWNSSDSLDIDRSNSVALDEISDSQVAVDSTAEDSTAEDGTAEASVAALTVQQSNDAAQNPASRNPGSQRPVASAGAGLVPVAGTETTERTPQERPATVDQLDNARPTHANATPVPVVQPQTTTTAVTATTTPLPVPTPTTIRTPIVTTTTPPTTTVPPTTTTTAAPRVTTPTTIRTPIASEPLEFEDRIDIGAIADTSVRFRFTTSSDTEYTVTVRSGDTVARTQTGFASAGALESITVGGLTPGTDYTVHVTLDASPSVSSTPVAFRTAGGSATPAVAPVRVQNLRLVSTESTRFEVNYESNVCANGSFTIREVGGAVVGSNAGQAVGCTTRHLGIPGFWTPALSPNSSYIITVTVEANGQGQGGGNTDSQSLTVTTSG